MAVEIRPARAEDVAALLQLQRECYPTLSTIAQWTRDHLLGHQRLFPDGQLVALRRSAIVGYSASFIVKSETALGLHTFRDITARGTFANHEPEGDTLYGAEIMVHPDHRRQGIARKFYEARFGLVRRLNLRYFVAGGRMPGYIEVQDEMTPQGYVEAVAAGRRTDRVLSAQLKSGLQVARILPNYLNDPKSANYATLLRWENADYRPGAPRASSPRQTSRGI